MFARLRAAVTVTPKARLAAWREKRAAARIDPLDALIAQRAADSASGVRSRRSAAPSPELGEPISSGESSPPSSLPPAQPEGISAAVASPAPAAATTPAAVADAAATAAASSSPQSPAGVWSSSEVCASGEEKKDKKDKKDKKSVSWRVDAELEDTALFLKASAPAQLVLPASHARRSPHHHYLERVHRAGSAGEVKALLGRYQAACEAMAAKTGEPVSARAVAKQKAAEVLEAWRAVRDEDDLEVVDEEDEDEDTAGTRAATTLDADELELFAAGIAAQEARQRRHDVALAPRGLRRSGGFRSLTYLDEEVADAAAAAAAP